MADLLLISYSHVNIENTGTGGEAINSKIKLLFYKAIKRGKKHINRIIYIVIKLSASSSVLWCARLWMVG